MVSKIRADCCIDAAWVLPVVPMAPLQDHSVVITDGRIVDVLPHAEARHRYDSALQVRCTHHLLMPGLVNAHTHAAMNLFKGMANDAPLHTWLQETIWPAEAALVSEAFVHAGCLCAGAELIASGVTCINDMYFHPEAAYAAFDALGLRARIGVTILEHASDVHNTRTSLEQAETFLRNLPPHPRISASMAPHAPYSLSNEGLQACASLCQSYSIPMHMHVHETAWEIQDSLKRHGMRPLARLKQLGVLGPWLQAVHMTQLTETDILDVSSHQVSVIHCPESNMKLASGVCPVHTLMQHEVPVALGTDGAASNNDLDMISEMRTASFLAKVTGSNPTHLPADHVLRMATQTGAEVLGWGDTIGSITPGKMADLVAIDIDQPHLQPLYDPIAQLVYAARGNDVSHVWIAGELHLADKAPVRPALHDWRDALDTWHPRVMEAQAS